MFDPNQPRIPKHHHGGGRWTRGGYGTLSDLGMLHPPRQDRDNAQPTLADLPHYAWLQDPLQRERPTYDFNSGGSLLPKFDPATAAATAITGWGALNWFRDGISAEEERGWDEYERLSEQNSANQRAIIKFKVRGREYRGRKGVLEYDGVEVLKGDQIKKVCPALDDVEKLARQAIKDAGDRDDYDNQQVYGTEVHFNLKKLIEKNPRYGLNAEQSFIISGDENEDVTYGMKDSRRTDAEEPVDPKTLCLHDLKTGKKGLSKKSMREIAEGAMRKYPKVRRIVVTEIKIAD